jgi:hypothetical protein
MSDFIKSQMDARNNLIAQAREVLDFAEAEKRGLSAEENQRLLVSKLTSTQPTQLSKPHAN